MTIAYRLDGALLPYETVRFNPDAEAAFPAAAWYGEPVVAGVIIEDATGSLDIDGWHTFTVEETACSKPRIFTGWIAGKEISRGRDSNRVGAARVWNCDIVDQNALFSFEVFRSSAASLRPAETDVARVQACIVSHAMGGTPIADNGRLSTDNPRNLSAANFVAQYPAEMLFSTAGQCAKNFYAYWDESADEISIHYDAVGDGPAATISFSNVPGDYGPIESASTTCFAPSVDATLSQDPYNLYTGVLLQDATGRYTYQRNADLIDALSPSEFSPVNFLRDNYESSSRIGRATTASAYVASQLARFGVEKVTIRFTVTLPARAVNLAHAGDIVNVRFSHLPGYTTSTGVTVIRRNVRPVDGHDALYDVEYECADFEGAQAGGGGNPPFNPQTCSVDAVNLEQGVYDDPTEGSPGVYEAAWDTQPTAGNMLIASWLSDINGTPSTHVMDGWTFRGQAHVVASGGVAKYVAMFTKVAEAGEPMDPTVTFTGGGFSGVTFHCHLQEWSGVDTVDAVPLTEDEDGAQGSVLLTVTPSQTYPFVLNVGSYGISGTTSNLGTIPATGPVIEDEQNFGANRTFNIVSYILEDEPGPYSWGTDRSSGTKGAAVGVVLVCSGTGFPPAPGQDVIGETPGGTIDGVNDDFTTTYPAAAGTLRVLHDGIDQTAHVTDYDEDTKTLTLDYAPSTGSTLRVDYKGL